MVTCSASRSSDALMVWCLSYFVSLCGFFQTCSETGVFLIIIFWAWVSSFGLSQLMKNILDFPLLTCSRRDSSRPQENKCEASALSPRTETGSPDTMFCSGLGAKLCEYTTDRNKVGSYKNRHIFAFLCLTGVKRSEIMRKKWIHTEVTRWINFVLFQCWQQQVCWWLQVDDVPSWWVMILTHRPDSL